MLRKKLLKVALVALPLGKPEQLDDSLLEEYAELQSCEGAVELQRILLNGTTLREVLKAQKDRLHCSLLVQWELHKNQNINFCHRPNRS